jgi:hypothetical protein
MATRTTRAAKSVKQRAGGSSLLAGGLGDGAESTYGFAPAGGTTGGGGGAISSGDRRGYAACSAVAGDGAGAGAGAEASGAGALASGLGSIGGDWGTVGDCQTGARWRGVGWSASLPRWGRC